jgi:hypothetical protein
LPAEAQEYPPAPQLPADAHETDRTSALPPLLRAAVPGTTSAVRQLPLTSLTTYATALAVMELPEYRHPTAQMYALHHPDRLKALNDMLAVLT